MLTRLSNALRVAVMAGVVVVAGCSTVETSEPLRPGATPSTSQGLIAYALPRALLSAELTAVGDVYQLDVFRPVLGPDPRYSLQVGARLSPFSYDAYKIGVDPKTGLLTSLEVKTKDQTTDILTALAQSAGAVAPAGSTRSSAGSTSSGEVLVAQVLFDPLDPMSIRAANSELKDGVRRWSTFRGLGYQDPGALIEILPAASGAPELGPFPSSAAVTAACQGALCAPTYSSVLIRGRAPNGPSVERIAHLPDARRLTRIDVKRSPMVTRETKASFEGGMPSASSVDKPSEVLQVVLLPITIVRAGLTAVSEVVQLKINVASKDAQYAKALDEAKAADAASATAAGGGTRSLSGGADAGDADSLLRSRSFGTSQPTSRDMSR